MHHHTMIGHTATDLARLIRSGEVSSTEVVAAHIEQIEAVNPQVNAVCWPLFDQARAEAAAADEARARRADLGPLHGVPVTIKECFDMAGTPSTLGLPFLRENVAKADGLPVARLRQAGAIVLGKTNVAQMLMMIETDNPLYGRTSNPWDLTRTPGGSSGGESAIIAAGGSPLGLGNDVGGSIRIPAHFTGIHGLKPTSHRLTHGLNTTGRYFGGNDSVAAAAGPLARSVADLELAMAVLAAPGQETVDSFIPPVAWPDWQAVNIKGMRIGFYTDDGYFPSSPALRRAVKEAAAALEQRGAIVEEWTPPGVAEVFPLFSALRGADGWESVAEMLKGNGPVPAPLARILQSRKIPRWAAGAVATLMERGGNATLAKVVRSSGRRTAAEYFDLLGRRNGWRMRFMQEMTRFDAVLSPPAALPAPQHGTTAQASVTSSYSVIYNLLGAPAGTVSITRVRPGEESDRPASRDAVAEGARAIEAGSAGLPVGVQVAARHWREDIVLAVMGALEEQFREQPDYPSGAWRR